MASTSQRLIRDLTTRLAALPEAAQPQDWRAQLATASEVLLSQPDVPVHGDCCLPNLLVDDQRSVSGIVDWAYGGIANAHWDWFYLRGSCERNGLLDEWPAIIDGYGSAPDKQALNAVEIIDDLMGALE
jgi:aminoglycoside phosphotransferase